MAWTIFYVSTYLEVKSIFYVSTYLEAKSFKTPSKFIQSIIMIKTYY